MPGARSRRSPSSARPMASAARPATNGSPATTAAVGRPWRIARDDLGPRLRRSPLTSCRHCSPHAPTIRRGGRANSSASCATTGPPRPGPPVVPSRYIFNAPAVSSHPDASDGQAMPVHLKRRWMPPTPSGPPTSKGNFAWEMARSVLRSRLPTATVDSSSAATHLPARRSRRVGPSSSAPFASTASPSPHAFVRTMASRLRRRRSSASPRALLVGPPRHSPRSYRAGIPVSEWPP